MSVYNGSLLSDCGCQWLPQVGLLKGLLYMVAQSAGAVVGAALLQALVPPTVRGRTGAAGETLGNTGLAAQLSPAQGVGVEFFITMVLVLVVFAAAADENNASSVKGSAPLAIGLSITTCHLFAIPLTGSSMNPARSLGPALVTGLWRHHWVYWVGPLLGGVAGALLYQVALRVSYTELVFCLGWCLVQTPGYVLYLPGVWLSSYCRPRPSRTTTG